MLIRCHKIEQWNFNGKSSVTVEEVLSDVDEAKLKVKDKVMWWAAAPKKGDGIYRRKWGFDEDP